MQITVTGAAGKLGRSVVHELLRDESEVDSVVAFDIKDAPQDVTEMPGLTWITGSMDDLGQVIEACVGADAIIHLAAIPRAGIVPDSVLFRTNIVGTFNAHEAARVTGVGCVVVASSVAVLGWTYRSQDFELEYLPIDEQHPVAPQDVYGLSKVVGEEISRSFTARCGMTTVAVRMPWIVDDLELAHLRQHGGRPATSRDLISYVSTRDAARAFAIAAKLQTGTHLAVYTAANDSSCPEPTSVVVGAYMPSLKGHAAELPEDAPLITNRLARDVLGWEPQSSWRADDDS